MPTIDMREIPPANGRDHQDQWELFARDYLIARGFQVLDGPDRGADGGRDLVVREERPGVLGTSVFVWLVSCKHHAHSGNSVTATDEADIAGRVRQFGAAGFLGFYSTLANASLTNALTRYRTQNAIEDFQIFDHELIEGTLIENILLRGVFRRYFPESFGRFQSSTREPSRILDEYMPLECAYCAKDLLLAQPFAGIVVLAWTRGDDRKKQVEACYVCCKGTCDRTLEASYRSRGLLTSWEDIEDLRIPSIYLRWVLSTLNRMRAGLDHYTDDAFDGEKDFILRMAQVVMREKSGTQEERLVALSRLPEHL